MRSGEKIQEYEKGIKRAKEMKETGKDKMKKNKKRRK